MMARVVSLFVLTIVGASGVQANEPNDALRRALILLEQADVNVRSIRVAFKVHNEIPLITKTNVSESEYEETSAGNRIRQAGSMTPKGTTAVPQVVAYDGAICRNHVPSQKYGTLKTGDKPLSQYFALSFGNDKPFFRLIQPHVATLRPVWNTFGGKNHLTVEWVDESRQTAWLDPEIDFMPRRQTVVFQEAKPNPAGVSGWAAEFIYEDYVRTDGVWFPKRVTRKFERNYHNGRKETGIMRLEATTIEANVPVTDDDFRIEFPEGTQVLDLDARESYVVGERGSRKKLDASRSASEPPPRTDWLQPWMSWWVAGVLVAATVFVAWRQWRVS